MRTDGNAIHCDKCQAELAAGAAYTGQVVVLVGRKRAQNRTLDLCERHAESFARWLGSPELELEQLVQRTMSLGETVGQLEHEKAVLAEQLTQANDVHLGNVGQLEALGAELTAKNTELERLGGELAGVRERARDMIGGLQKRVRELESVSESSRIMAGDASLGDSEAPPAPAPSPDVEAVAASSEG